jgi:radical SAM superfamily enzyme YgiQ (UPF0313 family)
MHHGKIFQESPFVTAAGLSLRMPLPPPADLDELALPARHLIPLGRYRALGMPISMTTSRGCPFKCIFCVGRKMVGARVRYRDPVRVVDEMQGLSSLGFHQINLADDLFTANPESLPRGMQPNYRPPAEGQMDLLCPGGHGLTPGAGQDAPGRMHHGEFWGGVR